LTEVLTAITTQMPPKPSTQQPLPEEADPGRLLASMRSRLAGDLDSILLMALRKEPERRYASAADFAADIERFQKGKSVVARGDAKTYLVMRTLKRNRWKIAVATVVLVSLSLGLEGFYLYYKAQEQAKPWAEEVKQLERDNALAATLPPEQARKLIQGDLDDLRQKIQDVSPELLQSNLAAKGITQELAKKSLANFVETGTQTGNDPETVASLGRAYLAVAETQWSPEQVSLNEPKAAAATCAQALQTLNATPQLAKNQLVQAVAKQILTELSQNPTQHTADSQD